MNKTQTDSMESQVHPIDWKQASVIGAIIGIPAGLITLFGANWFNFTIPFGMIVASWIMINRIRGQYFWNGFVASTIAGILAWIAYLSFYYQTYAVQDGNPALIILQVSLAFLAPMVLLVGMLGSWMFGRTRQRVLEAQAKMATEKQKQKQVYQNRPKKNKKKK